MSKAVLVINDQGQQRTLIQSDLKKNEFKEETEGAAAGHIYHLEIEGQKLVFKEDNHQSFYNTPIKKQPKNGSGGTLKKAKQIPLPQISIQFFPTSPLDVSTPSPDSSGFTSADDSGFSIDSDGTYSFGDGSPNKVRGRFILADSGEWELVLSEDPDAINLSDLTPQGRFLSPSESSESRLPGSPTIVSSPSAGSGENYRLRF